MVLAAFVSGCAAGRDAFMRSIADYQRELPVTDVNMTSSDLAKSKE